MRATHYEPLEQVKEEAASASNRSSKRLSWTQILIASVCGSLLGLGLVGAFAFFRGSFQGSMAVKQGAGFLFV